MSPILTCITGDAPTINDPEITAASSVAIGQVTIDGLRFISAPNGAVNRINIFTTDLSSYNFYDPTGPDAGLNAGLGNTIVSWTNTQIVFSKAGMSGKTIDQISVEDGLNMYFLTFTGAGITGVAIA